MGHRTLRHQVEALKLLQDLRETRLVKNNTGAAVEQHVGLRRHSPSHKPQTVAERARESLLSRLVDILSQIIPIERDLMGSLSEDLRSFYLRHKDSVDLKNICLRMAVSEAGCQSDKDLRELRVCLQLIVDNLLSALQEENSLSFPCAIRRLVGISTNFLDI